MHSGIGRLAILHVDVILNLVVAVGASFRVKGVLDVGRGGDEALLEERY